MNSKWRNPFAHLRERLTPARLFAWANAVPFVLAAMVPIPATAAGGLPTPCSASGACTNAQGVGVQQFTSDGVLTSGGNPSARYNIIGNLGTVQQYANKAIVNWKDFNIGAQNEVRYVRVDDNGNPIDGASFSTLNRIYQNSKSVIEGKISVQEGQNGSIYLINQNGILFKGTAQVDVNTLVASALNITDENFLSDNGIFNAGIRDPISKEPIHPAFYWEGTSADVFKETYIQVEPGAKLAAQLGGAILLLGPNVTNQGSITTNEGQVVLAAGAKVYITAPDAHLGDINVNTGQPVLSEDSPYRGLAGILVEVDPFQGKDSKGIPVKLGGTVTNEKDPTGTILEHTGEIIAQKGNVTLVGLAVNQNGRISATTSVTHKGSIRLLARQGDVSLVDTSERVAGTDQKVGSVNVLSATETGTLTFGKDSVTEVTPAPPEALAAQTLTDDQIFNSSTIEGIGKNIYLEDRARIYAPGGYVTLSAQAVGNQFQLPMLGLPNDSRIYQGVGSVIDVSGVAGAQASIERYFREVDLRASELKDNPLNRNALLRGNKIQVDLRDLPDSSLADLSPFLNTIPRNVLEKLSAGGSVTLRSEGDIVLRAGSKIDISGSAVNISGGYGSTSRLVSNGAVFDIAKAKGDRVYQAIINDTLVITDPKWGVTQSYNLLSNKHYYAGYSEGTAAGTLSLLAHAYALDGDVVAKVSQGVNQRATSPQRGALIIGDVSQVNVGIPDFKSPAVTILKSFDPLDGAFAEDTPLSQARADTTLLSSAMLNRSGLGKVAVYSNGKITVESNSGLVLPAFGELTLIGNQIEVKDGISASAGAITLRSQVTNQPQSADYLNNIVIQPGVQLSTAGLWVNDRLAGADLSLPLASANGKSLWDGGSVSLTAYDGISLGAGSVVDVSGSGYVNAAGKFKPGNAGAISLVTNKGKEAFAPLATLDLPADLRSVLRAQAPGKGGSLSLKVGALTIGAAARGVAGEFLLTPEFFKGNGFASYNLEGRDSVVVADGVNLSPTVASRRVNASFAGRATGSDINQFSSYGVLPVYQRQAVDLTLQARNDTNLYADTGAKQASGWLKIEQNAKINLDPGGSVFLGATGYVLDVEGQITTPAGNISLAINRDTSKGDLGYDPTQAIWIGSGAKLSATGAFVATPTNNGLRAGKVLDAGNITIDAQNGFVVAQQGAVLDVSAVATTLDIPLQLSPFIQPTRIAGNAGKISITAREGGLLDATLHGESAGGLGGRLALTLERTGTTFNGYPGTPFNDPARQWKIELTQNDLAVPKALKPGDNLDTLAPGRLRFGIDRAVAGGFEQLAFNAENAVAFKGNVAIPKTANLRALTVNAPVIESDGGTVALAANYVNLGNQSTDRNRQVAQTATGGTGTLGIAAGFVDLSGHFAFQGFKSAEIVSDSDVRLVGVAKAPVDVNTAPTRPEGSLAILGDLQLQAHQVYATTFSQYALNVDGQVTVARKGTPSPILSAGSDVAVNAKTIVFGGDPSKGTTGGALKAPLGSITLTADSITLDDGSIVSVSAEDQLIPFGRTDATGQSYIYSLPGGNVAIDGAPQKRIELKGQNLAFKSDATLDVSGGGDLLAYEFIQGIGGSKDVLSPTVSPNTFAILPSYKDGVAAPYDSQVIAELKAANVNAPAYGQSVYLNASGDLPAGYYTLLPARYALLPGAYLVTPAGSKYQDLPSTQSFAQIAGGTIVAGNFAALNRDGGFTQTSRSGGFLVEPGTLALTRSEYLQTRGSTFFSGQGGQVPGDAGRVVFEATKSLQLDGQLAANHAAGMRGAAVDISSLKLALVSPGGAALDSGDADAVRLDVGSLSRLGAESLFIGGTRSSAANGVDLNVIAQKVIVANDAQHDLTAPEIVLAATQQVQVKSGSSITATGTEARADDINITNSDGNGALLRVASTPQVTVTRNAANRSQGELAIEEKTTLTANGAINLDATKNTKLNGTLDLGNGAGLAIAAGSIGLGDVQNLKQGLNFDQTAFGALLKKTNDLRLTSYGTIDFYGKVDAESLLGGNAAPDLSLRATGLAGFEGTNGAHADVTLAGNRVTLSNPTATVVTPVLGNGKLTIKANELRTGDGQFALTGFAEATLTADSQIVAAGKGGLNTAAKLTLDAPRVTAEAGAQYNFKSSNVLAIASSAGQAAALSHNVPSAQLGFEGAQVKISGLVDLPGGTINVSATQGDLNINNGAVLRAAGREEFVFDAAVDQPGGNITLTASGKANLNAGSLVDVSATGADAGTLSISANEVNLVGDLKGDSVKGSENVVGNQGRFVLNAGSLAELGDLSDKLSAGGFTDSVRITLASGDTDLAKGKTLKAREIQIATDGGSITIAGTLDANHARGGAIALAAKNDVTLTKNALLQAEASDAERQGGRVEIATKDGFLDLQSGSSIKVAGGLSQLAQQYNLNGGHQGGQVWLRAGVDGNTIRVNNLASAVSGTEYLDASTTANLIQAARSSPPAILNATYLEAVQQVTFNDASLVIDTAKINTLQNGVTTFYNNLVKPNSVFRVVPGLEIINKGGDITLANNWNLGSVGASTNLASQQPKPQAALRFGANNEAGVLTLRAAGNITFNASLSDGFRDTSRNSTTFDAPNNWLYDTSIVDTWAYRIVAGSNFNAAAPLAVNDVNANVTVSAGIAAGVAAGSTSTSTTAKVLTDQLIRTGAGFIDIAAGRDIVLSKKVIGSGSSAVTYVAEVYTAGRNAPAVDGFSSTSNTKVYYPTSGGDIRLLATGNIYGQPLGGNNASSEPIINQWLYRYANIGQANPQTAWAARFENFRQGVATLGGGDITVEAKGNIDSLWLSAPTNARLSGDAKKTASIDNLLVQGGGDITERAGGNVSNGLIYVGQGQGKVVAGNSLDTRVALQDATAQLTAINDATVTDAFNPTVATQAKGNSSSNNIAFNSYGDKAINHSLFDAALQVMSRAGDVQVDSSTDNYVYPSLLSALAPQGNVTVGGKQALVLFPNAIGNLDLIAANDVLFGRPLIMSDYAVNAYPSITSPFSGGAPSLENSVYLSIGHDPQRLHLNDTRLARIYGGEDISVLSTALDKVAQLTLAKPGVVQAGRDINNLGVDFQNIMPEDISQLLAGRDLIYQTNRSTSGTISPLAARINIGGPGGLEVVAGRNIDLGASGGIVSVGDSVNPYLFNDTINTGAKLTVIAGLGSQGNSARMPDYAAFFDKYLTLDSNGKPSQAVLDYYVFLGTRASREVKAELEYQKQLNQKAGSGAVDLTDETALIGQRKQKLIDAFNTENQSAKARNIFFNELRVSAVESTLAKKDPKIVARGTDAAAILFPTSVNGQAVSYEGDLNLYFSQIKTERGGDIELFVPGGLLNVGLASSGEIKKTAAELGIITVRDGDVNAYVRGDISVNQSRIFTLGGSDILLWSDQANIDAGKGAKTASAAPPPKLVIKDGKVSFDISGSVSGSGIAAPITRQDVKKGNAILAAPNGIVDASDAGIAISGDLLITATEVRGGDNIKVGGESSGVPKADSGGLSGALNSLNTGDTSNATDTQTKSLLASAGEQDKALRDALANFRPSFITVEVVGFGPEGQTTN